MNPFLIFSSKDTKFPLEVVDNAMEHWLVSPRGLCQTLPHCWVLAVCTDCLWWKGAVYPRLHPLFGGAGFQWLFDVEVERDRGGERTRFIIRDLNWASWTQFKAPLKNHLRSRVPRNTECDDCCCVRVEILLPSSAALTFLQVIQKGLPINLWHTHLYFRICFSKDLLRQMWTSVVLFPISSF